jgi:hypothetical protein
MYISYINYLNTSDIYNSQFYKIEMYINRYNNDIKEGFSKQDLGNQSFSNQGFSNQGFSNQGLSNQGFSNQVISNQTPMDEVNVPMDIDIDNSNDMDIDTISYVPIYSINIKPDNMEIDKPIFTLFRSTSSPI